MWTLNEMITVTKQDMGIRDIPLPINDSDIADRIKLSALKEFSVRFPRMEYEVRISDNELISPPGDPVHKYRIPKHIYMDSKIISIPKVDPLSTSGFNDYYVPSGLFVSPDLVLSALSDIKMASAVAQSMSRALTHRFTHPDILTIFNGWSGGLYTIDIALEHDESLSTIPASAAPSFRKLVKLDMMEYIYGILKRKNQLDLLIGNIDLKIDDWESAADKKADLLNDWDDTSTLDVDSIKYY